MGKVLFVSQNKLDRAENMACLYNAYDGEKDYEVGLTSMLTAEIRGYSVVVCDALPSWIAFKDKVKSVVICHGMTGNKVYGADEDRDVDIEAFQQTDVATAASERIIPIVARELAIPEDRVIATGFPRTDQYFAKKKGDGRTPMAKKRGYLYAPTFRDAEKGGWLPRIDWEVVDSLLRDNEVFVLKRHYFTTGSLLGSDFKHVIEIDPMEPLTPYLIDCDALLTDYSSCMTDAYLMGKPVVLAVDDKEAFLADRPMYYPYPETYCSRWINAGGNEEALVNAMREAVENGIGPVEEEYCDLTAGACDGHSVERTVRLVKELANG